MKSCRGCIRSVYTLDSEMQDFDQVEDNTKMSDYLMEC